jgi:hypothetical protein
MAYVFAAMIEGLEKGLGQLPRKVTRMRKIKRVEEDEAGITREIQETEAQTIEVFQDDLGDAKGFTDSLAKLLAPVAGDEEGETIEQMTETRQRYMDELLAAIREGRPSPPMQIEKKKTR